MFNRVMFAALILGSALAVAQESKPSGGDAAQKALGQFFNRVRGQLTDTLLTESQRGELETAGRLSEEAERLYHLGQFREATPQAEKALQIRQKILGDRHFETALSCNLLAALCESQGNYAEAETLFRKAVEISTNNYGKDHIQTATAICNLAGLYETQGQYSLAEPLLRDAVKIHRATYGENHLGTANSLNSLGILLHSQGNLAEAELLLRRALELRRNIHGDAHAETSHSFSALAQLLQAQGKLSEADALLNDALQTANKSKDFPALDRARIMNNLASLRQVQRRYDEAERLYQDSLQIKRDVLGKDHLSIAHGLGNLATLYHMQRKFAEAKSHLREALSIARNRIGAKHIDTIRIQANLAFLCHSSGELTEAESLFREALDQSIEVATGAAAEPGNIRNSLAVLCFSQGRYKESRQLLEEGTRRFEAVRLLRGRSVERSLGTAIDNPYPLLAVTLAQLGEPALAFRAAEFDSARGFLDERLIRQGLGLTTDEQAEKTRAVERLQIVDQRIVGFFGRANLSQPEQQAVGQLRIEKVKLESDLAELGARIGQREVSDLAALQSSLRDDVAFVTWVDFLSFDKSTQEHWACVVRKVGTPHWERLPGTGPDNQWTDEDSALPVQMYRAILSQGNEDEIATIQSRLNAQRIAPIKKHLAGVSTLYVVGVRNMAGIPVELIAPNYTVSYIPSGTFLTRRGKPLEKPATLLAVGDPVFPKQETGAQETSASSPLPPGGFLITQVVPGGAASQALLKANDVLVSYGGVNVDSIEHLDRLLADKAAEKSVAIQIWRESVDKLATYNIAPGKLGVVLAEEPAREMLAARRKLSALLAGKSRGGPWDELPGSQVEINELTKLFGASNVTALTRSQASEQTLDDLRKQESLTKYRYLHFATHGAANPLRAFDSKLILAQDQPPQALSAPGNPLLDNQLTANEVLDFWKLDAELVTLSACETAIGRDGGGDGMLGFAQAFLLAGSRSVCLSLWKVDDTATALLMDRFYRNLLGKREDGTQTMGKAAALSEAKHWLKNLTLAQATDRLGVITAGVSRGGKTGRNVLGEIPAASSSPAESKPFSHPKYWAAFILIGDPD